MKKYCFVLFIILFNCTESKNITKYNNSNENIIQKNSSSIIDLPYSEIYKVKGYILNPKIAIYDNALNLVDSLLLVEDVAQVDILEKTKSMINFSEEPEFNPCPTANFLKIKYKDKNYIVYGTDIYQVIKEDVCNSKKKISVLTLSNFSVGASNDDGLTGCDDYKPLLILDNNSYYKIDSDRKDAYYTLKNNLDFFYLISDESASEEFKTISLNNDTIKIKIHADYQEGSADYDLNIVKKNKKYSSTLTNEIKYDYDYNEKSSF